MHGRAVVVVVVVGFFDVGVGVVVRCGVVVTGARVVVVGDGVVVFVLGGVVAVGHPVGFVVGGFVGCGVVGCGVVVAGTITVTVDGCGGDVTAGTTTVTVDGRPSCVAGGRDACTEMLPSIENPGPGPAVGVSVIVDGATVSVATLVSVVTGSPLTFSTGAESVTVTVTGVID
ncbi:hypothetical protein ACQPW1_19200 [Nocardia sp. CA-128927]|uniref:hypothetical protein n=1 Tax=Nocardia sp. CA-128927 TaxID=3239975 RepID=UPI003D9591DB